MNICHSSEFDPVAENHVEVLKKIMLNEFQ